LSTKIMKNLNRKLGVGALVSCMADALHPSAQIRDRFGTNGLKERRVTALLVIRLEEKVIRQRNVQCVVLRVDEIPNVELYAAASKVKLELAGPSESYFSVTHGVGRGRQQAPAVNPNETEANAVEVVENEQRALLRNGDVDIPRLIAEGYEVDDDNEPNVENIPDAGPPPLIEWSEWGWLGVDLRNENDQQRNHGARVPTSRIFFLEILSEEVHRTGRNT
jgi:hypothetical protein